MKKIILALLISLSFAACKQAALEKKINPREIKDGESFDIFPKDKSDVLTRVESNTAKGKSFKVLYKDTAVFIQTGKGEPIGIFNDLRFINSQNTAAVLVSVDSVTKIPASFLVLAKDGRVDAINLNLPSNIKSTSEALGVAEITRTNFLVNNDFIINSVKGNLDVIKRQNPASRIPGKFILYSLDKNTLVFLTEKSLYQVNYRTGETENTILTDKLAKAAHQSVSAVQDNYEWKKNAKGSYFLKFNGGADRVVDISSFKK